MKLDSHTNLTEGPLTTTLALLLHILIQSCLYYTHHRPFTAKEKKVS